MYWRLPSFEESGIIPGVENVNEEGNPRLPSLPGMACEQVLAEIVTEPLEVRRHSRSFSEPNLAARAQSDLDLDARHTDSLESDFYGTVDAGNVRRSTRSLIVQ